MRVTHDARLGVLLLALTAALGAQSASVDSLETNDWTILSVEKIWDHGQHNAFTDLARFGGRWFCVFREADAHVGGDGRIRVLASTNGAQWSSAALVAESGVDLRDPKLSITPDNRLMLVMGGSIYQGKALKGKQPRVSFSAEGTQWSAPRRVLAEDDWLWRVTWHNGNAYGLSYSSGSSSNWSVKLVQSADGVDYHTLTNFAIPGRPNEGTLRFRQNGDCVALLRREAQDQQAWIGVSKSPFTAWQWKPAGLFVGGPNFIVLPDGRMIASGRQMQPRPSGPKTFVGFMTEDRIQPAVILPSGGDTSYPGMVWDGGVLWVSYYSSHEGKTSIYLARMAPPKSP